jgi:hypothetical protein
VGSCGLRQVRDQQLVPVNAVMKFLVSLKAGNFLTS